MGQVLNSIDNMIRSSADNGMLTRFFADTIGATTAANITSGYVSAGLFPNAQFIVPSMGSNTSCAYMTFFEANQSASAGTMLKAVLLFSLGSLNVSTGAFTPGVSMPIRTVDGINIQTCSEKVFLVASSALTATTPVITITYTNQSGTASQTASLTLPTNAAVNSLFFVDPHLASADTAMQAVTNMTKSAGTAGTLVCYGVWILGYSMANANFVAQSPGPLVLPKPMMPILAGDKIGFVRHGLATASDLFATIGLVADN